MNAAHAELGLRAVKTAEIALQALEHITALLDDDCDETRVALYNPKTTVGSIRRVLEQASAELTAAERMPAPEPHSAALLSRVNAAREPHERPLTLGGGWELGDLQRVVIELLQSEDELGARVGHLERPVADRDAIAWEIGRSAGIRGDAESLNPFRVQR